MLDPEGMLGAMRRAAVRDGRVVWIGVRPARRSGLLALGDVALDPDAGLAGDHYRATRRTRQVTLIMQEEIAAIGSFLGLDAVAPERLRRNIVVSGINLAALRDRAVAIGPAVLEVTGECHPCSRMEQEFGCGGYNAVRGHGGITARIVTGGVVRIGDVVRPAALPPDAAG